jgi:hypothetical protein
MHRTLDVRTAAVIPTLLDEVAMDEAEIRQITDQGTGPVLQMIEMAKADGTLRPDVTFGDIGVMIVRFSRPLPGPMSRELNDQLAHRHLDLLIGGLHVRGRQGAVGGPAMTLDDLRAMQPESDPTRPD